MRWMSLDRGGACAAMVAALTVAGWTDAVATVELEVLVRDAETSEPVPLAAASVDGSSREFLTGQNGVVVIPDLRVGTHRVRISHVAYEPRTVRDVVLGEDRNVIRVSLRPLVRVVEEVGVRGTRETPLVATTSTRYRLSTRDLTELPLDVITDAIRLLPGVVVNGDRLYFRGVGTENVTPLIDGVVARDPLKGEWITPPPDALVTADFVAGAFSSEYGRSLGGVMDMSLASGGPTHHARVSYTMDHLALKDAEDFDVDYVTVSGSGPFPGAGFGYAVAWTGRLQDGHRRYDRGRAEQDLLDLVHVTDRMQGDQTGSVKLSYRPVARPWSASLSVVHASSRRKPYAHHYSRSGLVEYDFIAGRRIYRRFITDADTEFVDNYEMYEGPLRVPMRYRGSTLVMATHSRLFGDGLIRSNVRVARHRYDTSLDGAAFDAQSYTRFQWQNEPYFALYGDFPEFEDGLSYEVAASTRAQWRWADGHELSAGLGGTLGKHRYMGVDRISEGVLLPVGSTSKWMRTFDGYAYVEDEWWTDALSSLFMSVRYDRQDIRDYPGSAGAGRVSPRLGFRHPMTDVDALHVHAGLWYTFPTLSRHFINERLEGVTQTAQRTRLVEVGVQHHYSEKVVAYVTGYVRRYADVVLSEREPGEYDFLIGWLGGDTRLPPPPSEIDTEGLEVSVSVRPTRALDIFASASTARVKLGDRLLPWDRNLTLQGWAHYRPASWFSATTSWSWTGGAPYYSAVDAKVDRDRDDPALEAGRLPATFLINLRMKVTPRGSRLALIVDARNLIDRVIPGFSFSTYPASTVPWGINANHFLDYYLVTGETGGYALRQDDGTYWLRDVQNPETRSAGRNVRLGVELSW